MKVVITQLDGYAPPPLTGASAVLPAIVVAGTATKVTFNAQGLITSPLSLAAADVEAALGFTPYDGGANPLGFVTAAGVPSRVGQLVNDVGYITAAALSGYATVTALAAVASGQIATVTTVDGTPTPLPALPQLPAAQSVGRVVWRLTAQDAATGDVAIFDAVAGVKRPTPAAALQSVGTPAVTLFAADASMLACSAAFGIGAALSLVVTGIAGHTIGWTAKQATSL